jgi:small subunit ribosomal protein S17
LLEKERERAERRGALEGEVVSAKTSKTVNVMVYHTVYISKYQKTIRRRKKIMAHDAEETAKIGDFVRIVPSRPYSKRKRHILKDIVRRAKIVDFSDLGAEKSEDSSA